MHESRWVMIKMAHFFMLRFATPGQSLEMGWPATGGLRVETLCEFINYMLRLQEI